MINVLFICHGKSVKCHGKKVEEDLYIYKRW